MTFRLSEVADAIGSAAAFPPAAVSGWSVDSRTTQEGDLFFALRGPNQDGHCFVPQAFDKGALAAVVERRVEAAGHLLAVDDSHEALHKLAAWSRRRWDGTVIAVTGSAGKTTTKDVIAHLLDSRMSVGKTSGNYNNHVGLPLSVLRLPCECRVAVLEIGMNHAGEIRKLARIAQPQIGVVTNVGYAHMEFFDSIESVALAKRELIEALPAGGTAVLNADDPHVARFGEVHPGPVITFGFSADADVRAERVRFSPEGACFRVDGCEMNSPLPGRHGVLNVLAGLAVARLFDIRPEQLQEAVRSLRPGPMRGERLTHAGITIWNDCYNSNPDAARAMVDTLRETPARRRIAVLGEMLELGHLAEPLHREVGRYVARSGISVLVGIRGAARSLVDAAVEEGLSADAAFFFDEPATAGDFLYQMARPGDAILFKGSRGIRVEVAMEKLLLR
jgi:UDP-N-acetylmuramoyl-tripeptide--D-alanyl-D-alanine ligase